MLLPRRAVPLAIVLTIASIGLAPQAAEAAGKTVLMHLEPEGSPWDDLAWSAMEQVHKDTGAQIKRIGGIPEAAAQQQVRAMANAGFNPIVTMNDDLSKVALDLAPNFPKTNFILMESEAKSDLPNVLAVKIIPTQSAFIAGLVAAAGTKSDTLGFAGGGDFPPINRYSCGFESGAKYYKPDVKVDIAYINSFTDTAAGREVGLALFHKGYDIVMQAAALAGLGVLKAAAEADKQAVGVDVYQGDVAPGHVLWSALKDGGGAVYTTTKASLEGKFTPGAMVWDLSKGAKLYDERDFAKLSDDMKKRVTDAAKGLQDGSIKLDCP
jgi:basic membrane protein A